VHVVKGEKYTPEPLDAAEVLAIMDQCSRRAPTGIRDRALIALMYRTGLRISEALALRPSDVDHDRRTVTVRNGKGGPYGGPRHRVVGTDDGALAHVAAWEARRAALGVGGRSPLFSTLAGGPLSGSQVRAMLHRRAGHAGIDKRVTPHQLRHSMARELLEEGAALPFIQRQLGHASLDATAHYLNRIAPADLAEGMRSRPGWE
jgi:site-specific recombinase XerD